MIFQIFCPSKKNRYYAVAKFSSCVNFVAETGEFLKWQYCTYMPKLGWAGFKKIEIQQTVCDEAVQDYLKNIFCVLAEVRYFFLAPYL